MMTGNDKVKLKFDIVSLLVRTKPDLAITVAIRDAKSLYEFILDEKEK